MSDLTGKQIVTEVRQLMSERSNIESQWELIKRYVTPFRGNFFEETMGEQSIEWRRNREIYDSTAVQANNTLASSIHGAMTSAASKWFELSFRSSKLRESQEIMAWIEECGNIVYEALQDSNFNLQANETYIDLTSYGTSVIVEEVEETATGDFEDLVFQSVPVEQCYFVQDYKGNVTRLYRKMKWTMTQIVTKFGVENLPDSMLDKAVSVASGIDDGTRYDVIFAIYNRHDKKEADISGVLAPLERPTGFRYVMLNGGDEIGEIGGYYEMPAFIPRWRKTADSKFGNSPAMNALADILTLNQLVEMTLTALEKVVDPAIITTERGLMTDLDLGPAGINIVRKMGEMEAFESRARFDVAELHRKELQASIRAAFFVDQLELKDSPAMTAMEVSVRYEMMQRLLGPTLGRMENDFLNPMIKLTFNNMMRYDKFPPIPEQLIKLMQEGEVDLTMDIIYTGPLARAQKMDMATAVERYIGSLTQMAEINPEVLDIPDFDKMSRELGLLFGVPARFNKSQVDVDKIREARQKKQDVMEKAQAAEQVGKAGQAMNDAGMEAPPMEMPQ